MERSLNINSGYIKAVLCSTSLLRLCRLAAAGHGVTEEDSKHVASLGLIEHNTIDCRPLLPPPHPLPRPSALKPLPSPSIHPSIHPLPPSCFHPVVLLLLKNYGLGCLSVCLSVQLNLCVLIFLPHSQFVRRATQFRAGADGLLAAIF